MSKSVKEDIEANQFAMELLMPRDWMLKDIEPILKGDGGIDDEKIIQRLAKKYKVTEPIMTLRIIQLGFLKV